MLADYYSHEYYEHICFNKRETSMSTEIVIEKGVPLPTKKTGRKGYMAEVFAKMTPGDSVVLKGNQRGTFTQFMRRHKYAYATRMIERNGTETLYRCWRVDGRRKAA